MTSRLLRIALLMSITVGGVGAAVLLTGESARTQEPKEKSRKLRDEVALQCINCHSTEVGSSAYQRYEKANWGDTKAKVTDFIKLHEGVIWDKQDMHSQAFARLDPNKPENTIARQMQQNLAKMHSDQKDYLITNDNQCLACHATDLDPKAPIAGKQFQTEFGVGCEACHGAGNKYIGEHFQGSWHDMTPAQKTEKGLVDLRDPATRTDVCVACHVGNIKQGKFVTHEMYAAGHPPLPAFELVTFSRDEPAHYHQPKNVALESLDPKKALTNYHYRPNSVECSDARNLAVGSVGTMKAYTELIADAAAKAKPDEVLDFALFDCYACHHELKIPSFRQARGYKGAPGRPTLAAWPGESTRVLLKSLEGVEGFDKARASFEAANAEMQKAIELRPFGSPTDVVKAGKPLSESCKTIQDELSKLTFDTARTEKLYSTWLEFVKKTPKDKTPGPDGLFLDYFGAQQAGWSIRVLEEGLRGRPGLKIALPAVDTADARQKALNAAVTLELRTSKVDNKAPSAPIFNKRMEELGRFDLGSFLDAMNAYSKTGSK